MSDTLNTLRREKVIAIVRGIDSSKILDLAQAIRRGGISCMEVTFDQSSRAGIDNTVRAISQLSRAGGLCVGAGTVMNAEQVRLARAAGATYIISPHVDEEVIAETKRLGLVSIPGALTPTEVVQAYRCGADLVKVFPANSFGPGYIKALMGPLSHIPLLAVGGVRPENCAEYVNMGCVGVGVGGSLVSPKLVDEKRFDEITAVAQAYMAALHPDGRE